MLTEQIEPPGLPSWLADLVPDNRYQIDLGDYRVHVMEAGDPNGRAVLMVHGNPTWGFLYRRVVGELPDRGFRIIIPDLVGLGFSGKPRDAREHRLDSHQRWLGVLIEALDLQDVLLVVQDWGGPIGVGAFHGQQERLTGLVVLNTVLGPPRPRFRSTTFHRFSRLPMVSSLVFRGLGFPQRALWMAQGDRSSISGTVARAYRYPLRRFVDRVAPLALARMVPDSHQHPSIAGLERSQAIASSFAGPSAIVWGDRDPVLGRAFSRVARLLPAASVRRTEAGHFLQEEVPAEIAEAIERVADLSR
jgi:haloalkane dehalogenase